MSIDRNRICAVFQALLLACGLTLIVSCGQQSSSSSSLTETAGDTTVTVEAPAQDKLDIDAALATGSGQIYSPLQSLRINDTDGDGIADSIDPDPDTPPKTADAVGSDAFILDSVHAVDGDNTLDAALLQGAMIRLNVTGAQFYAGMSWVVYETTAGYIAERPEQISTGLWQAKVPERYADIHGVHLIKGNYRTNTVKTVLLRQNQPRLHPYGAIAMAGQSIELQGRYLQKVEQVILGQQSLTILNKTDDRITVALPLSSMGNRLTVFSDGKASNVQLLDYRHDVELSIADAMQTATGRQYRTYHDGQLITLSGTDVRVPRFSADRPVVLQWDILDANGNIIPGSLATLIFPGQLAVELSAENSLLAEMYKLRAHIAITPANEWKVVWHQLNAILGSTESTRYVDELEQSVIDNSRFEKQARLKSVLQQVNPSLFATTQVASTTSSSIRTLRFIDTITGDLDGLIPVVVSHRAIAGRASFAGFTVKAHTSCSFTLESITAPDNLWPSDLCIKNSSKVYASAAVYIPDNGNTDTYKKRDIVTGPHISSWFDTSMIGGSWGFLSLFPSVAYLTDKNGVPLCKMRTCFVEILTGGLTSYKGEYPFNQPLSYDEKKVINILMARTVVDQLLIPVITALSGAGEDTSESACFKKKILSDSGLYYPTTADFAAKYRVATNKTDIMAAFNDTYGKYIIDKLLSEEALKCFPAVLSNGISSRIENELEHVSGKAVSYYKVAKYIKAVIDVFVAVITPEKIIYKITPRAEVIKISPRDIDLEDVSGKLYIHGNQLAVRANAPDNDERHPVLVMEDKRKNKVEMRLTAAHLKANYASDYYTNTRHEIDLLELLPFLGQLDSGPLRLTVKLDHRTFSGYPSNVLPVPANRTISLLGLPKISGFSPSMVYPGQRVSVSGQRFSLYSSDNQVLLQSSDGSIIDVINPEFKNDKQLAFDVPDGLPAGAYSIVLYSDFSGSLISDKELAVAEYVIPTVTFIDSGPTLDDSMTLTLDDKDNNVIDFYEVPVASTGKHRLTAFWDNLVLPAPVAGFSVTCYETGSDDTCTYALELTNASICKLTGDITTDCVSGDFPGFIKGGQLSQGETVSYGLR